MGAFADKVDPALEKVISSPIMQIIKIRLPNVQMFRVSTLQCFKELSNPNNVDDETDEVLGQIF